MNLLLDLWDTRALPYPMCPVPAVKKKKKKKHNLKSDTRAGTECWDIRYQLPYSTPYCGSHLFGSSLVLIAGGLGRSLASTKAA